MDKKTLALEVNKKTIKNFAAGGSLAEHKAKLLEIKNENDLAKGTDQIATIKSLRGKIKEEQDKIIKPLKDHVKFLDQTYFRPFLDALDLAEDIVRGKMNIYQTKKINKAEEKSEDLSKKHKETVEVAVVTVVEGKKTAAVMETRMVPKYKVEDFKKVPDKYKMLDTRAVRVDVQAGEREIPGLEIWEEASVAITENGGSNGSRRLL